MYKIENENTNIIARFTESPIESGALKFDANKSDIEYLKNKWKKLNKFLINRHANPLIKIKRVYEFIEQMLEITNVKSNSVCQKGCSHCCFVDVDVSLIEALYISNNTDLTLVERNNRLRSGYHKGKQYCTMLNKESGTCTIHEFRPMACRVFFAFDNPKFCERNEGGVSHGIYNANSSNFLSHIRNELFNMSGMRSADIREWFQEYTKDPYRNVYSSSVKIQVLQDN